MEMDTDTFINIDEQLKEKNDKIKELQEKLIETETKLNELNKDLENRVIERTVEIFSCCLPL